MINKILCLIITLSAALLMMAGCSAKNTQKTLDDEDIITISLSDESKKYEEEVIVQDGVKTMLTEENFDGLVSALSNRGEQMFPECDVKNELDSMIIQGSKVYSLTSEGYDKVVLYTHGGAWTFEISQEHVVFCDDLATKLNAKVYMPLYPLAPSANSEQTYAVIEGLYKEIIKEGKKVYIMGDSAGANITLGLMYTIKQENLTKPDRIVLISPCADMTFSNKEMEEINKTDPELNVYGCSRCAEIWAGKENLKNPKNSALYANLTDYTDTMIFHGTNDILYPDTLLLYQKMKDAGVNVTLVKGEGLWHVFPIYPIPEKEEALDLIYNFCQN